MLRELSARLSDQARTSGLTTFLNPYSYLVLRARIDLIRQFENVCCDGIFLQKLLNFAGLRVGRASFDMTSLAPVVIEDAIRMDRAIYFIGGEPGIAGAAVNVFVGRFPGLKVAGARSGFFSSPEERREFIQELVALNPAVVLAGMGTPLQERFLVDLRSAGWVGCGYTCGGFFHQTAKRGAVYYPHWMNRLQLRFLFRMWDEPKLIRRYFVEYPKFLFFFAVDLLSLARQRFFGRVGSD